MTTVNRRDFIKIVDWIHTVAACSVDPVSWDPVVL